MADTGGSDFVVDELRCLGFEFSEFLGHHLQRDAYKKITESLEYQFHRLCMGKWHRLILGQIEEIETTLGVAPTVTFPSDGSRLETGWIVRFENPRKRTDREIYNAERVEKKDGMATVILRSLMGK